jgi:ribosomal protein L17
MKGVKRSVQVKQQKERIKAIEEINTVVRNAVKNYDFLSSLIVEGSPEETYYNIKDFREHVEEMIAEFKKEHDEIKKGDTK